jgi:hypothetical protein
VPGVVTNLNDTVTGTARRSSDSRRRNSEGRLTIDGLNIGNPPGGNQPPAYIADVGNAQEVTFITSGGLGETETAGLTMNIVPRTGGNRMTGSLFISSTGQNLQSNNLTPELIAQGAPVPTPLQKVYDLNGAIGGPVKQDKVCAHQRAHAGQHASHLRHLANASRRREQVALRGRSQQPDVFGPHVGEHERPHHVADYAAQQVRRVLG